MEDVPLLDLCYEEDSHAMVDLNCVMNDRGELIELQGTGEGRGFTVQRQRNESAGDRSGTGTAVALDHIAVNGDRSISQRFRSSGSWWSCAGAALRS